MMRCFQILVFVLTCLLQEYSALPLTPTCPLNALCGATSCGSSDTAPPLGLKHFSRRAPGRLPTGDGDLRKQMQNELKDWILKRSKQDDVQSLFGQTTEEKMRRGELIVLQNNAHEISPHGIPTSKFAIAENEPFTWVVENMEGCTSLLVVRESDGDEDHRPGAMYLAHTWESPGFAGEPLFNMASEFEAWVSGFLEDGFPNKYIKQRHLAFDENILSKQDSLAKYKDFLDGGKAIIAHPQRFPSLRHGTMESDDRPQAMEPQYPKHLDTLKKTVHKIIGTADVDSYLYLPNRKTTPFEKIAVGRVGKLVFQYDPNFNGRKTGMLLIGDGGPKSPKKPDGTYGPGQGGPFFYDFGKAHS